MKRTLTVVLVAAAVTTALNPGSATALWGDTYCTASTAVMSLSSPQTRQSARSNMDYNRFEGYHWGGGCANNDDRDNAPNQVPQTSSPRGEGSDCSGLVWRTWFLGNSSGTTAHYTKYQYGYVHGPFTANSFRSSTTAWTVGSKSTVAYMDAFASTGHIAMYNNKQADGTVAYFEAKQESVGTGVFVRTYLTDSSYSGVRRNGWG